MVMASNHLILMGGHLVEGHLVEGHLVAGHTVMVLVQLLVLVLVQLLVLVLVQLLSRGSVAVPPGRIVVSR